MTRERQLQLPFSGNERILLPCDEQLIKASKNVYDKVHNSWQAIKEYLPANVLDGNGDYIRNSQSIAVSPEFYYVLGGPTIQKTKIPEEFKAALSEVAQRSQYGKRAYIPIGFFELCLSANGAIYTDKPNRFDEIAEKYGEWSRQIREEWFSKTEELKKIHVAVQPLHEEEKHQTFVFSPDKQLIEYYCAEPIPLEVPVNKWHQPQLHSSLHFRQGSLTSIWKDYPNGTFFEDPKGARNEIWPAFLGHYDDDRPIPRQATKERWETYLENLDGGFRVRSGRTLELAKQTRAQAEQNLERWRNYIYNKSIQTFHFYRQGNVRYFAEVGYSRYGKYGKHIVKNPQSYQILTPGQIKYLLTNWQPGFN